MKLQKLKEDLEAQKIKARETDLAMVSVAGFLAVDIAAQKRELEEFALKKTAGGTNNPWITKPAKKSKSGKGSSVEMNFTNFPPLGE